MYGIIILHLSLMLKKRDIHKANCLITEERNFSVDISAGYAKNMLETIRRLRHASASGMQQVQRVRECI